MASGDEETLYCICREPYDGQRFMIECDKCNDWFHGSCVDIQEHQATDIETYHCPACQLTYGPLVLKKKRNSHRHDYAESEENTSKVVQTGTIRFITGLKGRTFPNAEEVMAYMTDGYELDMEFLEETEFHYPIVVLNKEGLDLRVPPTSFSIQDVENHIGSMREIDVIDVAKQEDCKMLMREWTEYYTGSVRDKVLNVISLEFSKTRLSELVEPPRIVRQMSWVNNYWPADTPGTEEEYEKPCVQKYCLMSIKDSYTDFHIDFGGTSVWYHVLRGEKIFYLIEPTSANLQLYETWISSHNQSESFFADQVQQCYKCVVKQGQTMFIPTGWIHAVLTPIDSLVFGGNFLHNFDIELQTQVYDIEKRVGAQSKYLFPNFETLHWYTAVNILKILQGYGRKKKEPPFHLLNGAKALTTALKAWTHKRDSDKRVPNVVHGYRMKYIKRDNIPDTIQYGKLLKDLQREVRQHTKAPLTKKPRFGLENKSAELSKSESNPNMYDTADTAGDTSQSDIEVEVKDEDKSGIQQNLMLKGENVTIAHEQHVKYEQLKVDTKQSATTPTKGGLKSPRTGDKSPRPHDKSPPMEQKSPRLGDRSPRALEKSPRFADKSPTAAKKSPVSSSPRSSLTSPPSTNPRLTFRLPKPTATLQQSISQSSDISVYDFEEETNATSETGTGSEMGSPLQSPRSRLKSGSSEAGCDLFSPPHKLTLKLGASAATQSRSGDKRSVSTSQESSQDSESDSETEQLVVDESPRKRRKMAASGHSELKLKFSVKKCDIQEPSFDTSQDSSHHSTSDIDVVGDESPSKSFSPPYHPAGPRHRLDVDSETVKYSGIDPSAAENKNNNGSILQASDYTHKARQACPSSSMRDAIQGMLNMSQLSTVSSTLQKTSTSSPFVLDKEKSKATLRLQREQKARSFLQDDEIGDRLSTAYRDDEFIYPTLAESDGEEEARARAGKQQRDEAWNPRGKVMSSTPKMERPPRYAAKKESVESQLEDAAAKLANKPTPKRQYVKRKPKPEHSPTQHSASCDQTPSSSSYTYDPTSPAPLFVDDAAPSSSVQRSQLPDSTCKQQQQAGKKQRKGSSTAKQRLGKILGIHKMGLF